MDKLFDTKRKYTANDGDEYIDMSIPVTKNDGITGFATVLLNQDDNGRIDRFVWKSVSKNLDMIDSVMYANHIFNPFAVKEGDKVFIPNDDGRMYSKTSEPVLPDGTIHSKNVRGDKDMTYAERVEFIARKGLGLK